MESILILGVGIVIGMLIVITINVKKTKEEEKQFFEEYKELVEKCFVEDEVKKKNSNES